MRKMTYLNGAKDIAVLRHLFPVVPRPLQAAPHWDRLIVIVLVPGLLRAERAAVVYRTNFSLFPGPSVRQGLGNRAGVPSAVAVWRVSQSLLEPSHSRLLRQGSASSLPVLAQVWPPLS